MVADEPPWVGGSDAGPSPYGLLGAALGACSSMTLQMYAKHKQWPLEAAEVRVRHKKIHAEDCEDCLSQEGTVDRFERTILLEGDLDQEQRSKLLEIANRCPVHRSLTGEIKVTSSLAGE
jgi:putative redox protein